MEPMAVNTRWDRIDRTKLALLAESRGIFNASLDWIPAAKLTVGPAFQRPITWAWVRKLAREFDPDMLDPILVSLRADGTYAVIDGQHRILAVREIGWDDQNLPCLVRTGLTYEAEAALFVAQDNRKKLTQIDLHRGRVERKDPVALSIEDAVRSAGFVISAHRDTQNISAIKSCYDTVDRFDITMLADVLDLARLAWREAPGNTAITGIPLFLHRYPAATRTRLLAALFTVDPRGFERLSAGLSAVYTEPRRTLGARNTLRLYNKWLSAHRLPEWDAVALSGARS